MWKVYRLSDSIEVVAAGLSAAAALKLSNELWRADCAAGIETSYAPGITRPNHSLAVVTAREDARWETDPHWTVWCSCDRGYCASCAAVIVER